jgi:hypothetical protein
VQTSAHQAYVPKPMTSWGKADRRFDQSDLSFDQRDFIYVVKDDE